MLELKLSCKKMQHAVNVYCIWILIDAIKTVYAIFTAMDK